MGIERDRIINEEFEGNIIEAIEEALQLASLGGINGIIAKAELAVLIPLARIGGMESQVEKIIQETGTSTDRASEVKI